MSVNKTFRCVAAMAFLVSLSGCQNSPNASSGAVAGAVLGAALGAATGSSSRDKRRNAMIGAAVGAAVGAGIGAHFDRQDRERQLAAAYTATTTGRRSSWSDPQKGTAGTVEPIGYASMRDDGLRCTQMRYREMSRGVVVNSGQTDSCLDRNGNLILS